jgi:post-segregation antitoxin (ccd killing protein)
MIKTSVTIPDDLFKEARRFSDNFSALVAEAIKDYMRKKKVERALNSFGKWEERDTDSVNIVNELRSEKGRDLADSSH